MVQYITTNNIQLAYEDYPGTGLPLLLLHGLTANMANFAGLIRHGLAQERRVILVDLRGRGLSDKPASGYSMADHATDILGLLDALALPRVILGGHSFGGLLTMFMAAHHPERVEKMVIIDAGIEATDTGVLEKIRPSLERLGKTIPSWELYIGAMKASPYYADGFWDDDLEAFYRYEVETLADGSVRSRTAKHAIEQAIDGVMTADWPQIVPLAGQKPALLIHANGNIGALPPILSTQGALQTVSLLGNCQYRAVGGHHVTMVFGPHADEVVQAIKAFL